MSYFSTEPTKRLLTASPLFLVIFAGFSINSSLATAEDTSPIVTDRPSASAASLVVPAAYVQVETGYTYIRDKADGVKTTSQGFPETVVRIGLLPRAELRLGVQGHIWQTTEPGQHTSGFGDGEVGTKLSLWNEDGIRPQTALIAGVTLPFGEKPISSERVNPFIKGIFSHTLTERLQLLYNLGVGWETEEQASGRFDTFASFRYTMLAGFSLTNSLGLYGEFFGNTPSTKAEMPTHLMVGLPISSRRIFSWMPLRVLD